MKKKTKIGLGTGLGIYGLLHLPIIPKKREDGSTLYMPVIAYISSKLGTWIPNLITPLAPYITRDKGKTVIQSIVGLYTLKI